MSMIPRNKICKKTIMRNSIRQYKLLIEEYELVKNKVNPRFNKAKEFYEYYHLKRQTFIKFYNRYKVERNDLSLLPKKRGPKFINLLTFDKTETSNGVSNRTDSRINNETYNRADIENKTNNVCSKKYIPFITNKVVKLREKGFNKFEINSFLKVKLGERYTPSLSTVYRIFERNNLNKKTIKMKQNKRKIIKTKAGELGHIDCHYLPKGLIKNEPTKRYFLLGLIDDCTRICWLEVLESTKSLDVMFATLQTLNRIYDSYNFKFKTIMTDNGSEFTSKSKKIETKRQHPLERLLIELGIKHIKTKPYRPQTNGKIERFWRTVEDEAIEGTDYKDIEELKDIILKYNVYYNELRQHQAINNKTPKEFLKGVENMVD